MNRQTKVLCAVGIAVALVTTGFAADKVQNPSHRVKIKASNPQRPMPGGGPQFGDPVVGLNAEQMAAFLDGRDEFEAAETPEGGLGPVFNNVSCVSCHSAGSTGGASAIAVTRFGRKLADGSFDPLTALGGTLLHEKSIDPGIVERVPPEANVVAKRLSTPLFGAGLVEAILDSTIVQNSQIRQGDGVRGKLSIITDVTTGRQRIGRFGWKAQQATLLAFAGDAYINEMGITNRFFPNDTAPNGNAALLAQFDKVGDPEDVIDPAEGKADVDFLADFMRSLAPPPVLRMNKNELDGQKLFVDINCSACHTPVMFSGPSSIMALSNVPVPLFSDLLLHDMGSLGDGIVQGMAGQREMKTSPLWGLRARGPFLHDGRAATVTEAIQAHDGEARAARNRFGALDKREVKALLAYLATI